ncbi:MAG: HAMP domain-containing sensor histidine kinase [Campylobacterota bacterium]|nr:HAMP domain-containing sensor histidine kinase [Campylobacterota bacterium]
MENKITQEMIDDIIDLSKKSDTELQLKIRLLVDLYKTQEKNNQKLIKENNFFKSKLDNRHNVDDKKNQIIEQQSRMVAMGEMIDSVAHQWKQPLNAISMLIELLTLDFAEGKVDDKYIDELYTMTSMQIEHMITTLNEFRNFLRPSTKNETFSIQIALDNVQILMRDELIAQNIHLNLDIDEEAQIFGNRNELKHLFINIINNAIDVFNERSIKKREIKIRCYKDNNRIYIKLEDNAGGIPSHILEHVFEQNFTSKEEGKGTGIGLYMSTQIAEKNNGSIEVQNSDIGALFTIILPQF